MNQQEKRKLMLLGSLSAFVGFSITSRYMDKRRARRRAQEEHLRQQAHIRFMKSLEALDSHLQDQLVNARYWEQVTRDL